MRADTFHEFNFKLSDVYNAYEAVLRAKPFNKSPSLNPNLIVFELGFSFKYNMNGGGVHIHFSGEGFQTKVQLRYTIAQLMGARVKAYDDLLTSKVNEYLEAHRFERPTDNPNGPFLY